MKKIDKSRFCIYGTFRNSTEGGIVAEYVFLNGLHLFVFLFVGTHRICETKSLTSHGSMN